MDNILTLNRINRSDSDEVGFKAVDLSELYSKKINIPICFVIKNTLFDNFIENNGMRAHIDKILSKINYSDDNSIQDTFREIKELFSKFEFSEVEENELMEAYETLAIDIDHIDIAKLVTTIDKPYLTIIGSPNYVDDSENNENIFYNIRGKKSLMNTLKSCWLSLYSPRALKYRKDNDFQTREKMAVIVQRMVESNISAQAYTDEENIVVQTFIGYQDYQEEFEKDVVIFDKGTLNIKNTKINFQEYQYIRDMRDNNLVKKALKVEGEKQKVNDKDAEELARITKKVEGFLEKPVKVFLSIAKSKIYLIFANRVIRKKKNAVEEETISEEPPIENTSKTTDSDEPVEMVNIDDDVAFLDEIEAYEKEVEKEDSDWVKDGDIGPTIPPIELEVKEVNELIDDVSVPNEQTAEEEMPVLKEEPINDEVEEVPIPEEQSITDEVTMDEEPISIDDIPEAAPIIEEEPAKIETEESDDFIFSAFEESEKAKDNEVVSKPAVESVEEPAIEENTSEPILQTTEESILKVDPMEKALGLIKEMAVLSDEAIYDTLKKKHLETIGKEAESFEDAIKGLKTVMRVPFVEEINKIHDIRQKVESQEDIEIEEATIALRTAKNFLSIFK
ncbi:hypothetical protein H8D36_04435 [archaeon]|nr:hypothetical protein [archaeon]MBL7057509.1 hypothetical protein [Candidatus Woesearchaeota archaeon]